MHFVCLFLELLLTKHSIYFKTVHTNNIFYNLECNDFKNVNFEKKKLLDLFWECQGQIIIKVQIYKIKKKRRMSVYRCNF